MEILNSYGTKVEAWGTCCVRCGQAVDSEKLKQLDDINASKEAEKIAEEEAKRRVEEEQRQAREAALAAEVDELREVLRNNIQSGERIYSYRSVYVPVNSYIQGDEVGEFDIQPIRLLGIMGWRVVSAVPRTSGEALTNISTSGKSWGAGMGGNVLGVHILLERLGSTEESNVFEEGMDVLEGLVRSGVGTEQIMDFLRSP